VQKKAYLITVALILFPGSRSWREAAIPGLVLIKFLKSVDILAVLVRRSQVIPTALCGFAAISNNITENITFRQFIATVFPPQEGKYKKHKILLQQVCSQSKLQF
jgi:hypothetical protein